MLDAPDDESDLWSATGDEVAPHRMLLQGDVVILDDQSPVVIATHACSMRRGPALHDTQMVAAVRDQSVPLHKWASAHYDWMPLPGIEVPGIAAPAGYLRTLETVKTSDLLVGRRIGVMSDIGICLFQQRLAHHLTRVAIERSVLAEFSAGVLAEAELHEDWVADLGEDAAADLDALLDADERKIRNWLGDASTRNQAMATVRKELKARRNG